MMTACAIPQAISNIVPRARSVSCDITPSMQTPCRYSSKLRASVCSSKAADRSRTRGLAKPRIGRVLTAFDRRIALQTSLGFQEKPRSGSGSTAGLRRCGGGESLRAEAPHGKEAEHEERREQRHEHAPERGLALRGRERVEERDLLERLNHRHEGVQKERDQRGGHVDPTPVPRELEDIEAEHGQREQQERRHAKHPRRIESVRRDGKAG